MNLQPLQDKAIAEYIQLVERRYRHLITVPNHSEQAQLCRGVSGPHYAKDVRRRRMNTMYCDDKENWQTCCPDCFAEMERHWAEQWDEYYSMVL